MRARSLPTRPARRLAGSLFLATLALVVTAQPAAEAATHAPTRAAARPPAIPQPVRAAQCNTSLVRDRGFEDGRPWFFTGGASSSQVDNWFTPDGDGLGFASVGSLANGSATVSQTIEMPASHQEVQLNIWYRVLTNETTTTSEFDSLVVELVAGSDVRRIFRLTNLDGIGVSRTKNVWFAKLTGTGAFHPGEVVTLRITSREDVSLTTEFDIDGIRLVALC